MFYENCPLFNKFCHILEEMDKKSRQASRESFSRLSLDTEDLCLDTYYSSLRYGQSATPFTC